LIFRGHVSFLGSKDAKIFRGEWRAGKLPRNYLEDDWKVQSCHITSPENKWLKHWGEITPSIHGVSGPTLEEHNGLIGYLPGITLSNCQISRFPLPDSPGFP